MAFEGKRQDPGKFGDEISPCGLTDQRFLYLKNACEIHYGGRNSSKNQFHLSFLLSVWVVEST